MIDWISCNFDYFGPNVGVHMLKRETFNGPIIATSQRAKLVEGSFSSSVAVQVIGGRMFISGNPVKWFTGQNVCGTNDLATLIFHTFYKIIEVLDLPDCIGTRRAFNLRFVSLTRVDCTFAYRVGTDDDVVSWLQAMEGVATAKYRGRGHFDAGMCALRYGISQKEGQKPKASRSSTFKFYNKYREMLVHPPTCDQTIANRLHQDVLGYVRAEACYRGSELKANDVDSLRKWDLETCWELHKKWIDKLEISANLFLKSEQEAALPRWLQSTYHLWRSGVDLRGLLSRPTFYRHRKALLELDIDIAAKSTIGDPVKVVPIIKILEAVPMDETDHEELFWSLLKAA
jgi:hypothetical protein